MVSGQKPRERTAWLMLASGLSVLLLGGALAAQLVPVMNRPAGTDGTSRPPGQARPPGAATGPVLSADGSPLDGSSRAGGKFMAAVNAPDSATVKFKIDGTYLGQDNSSPHTWSVQTGPGSHTLEARWDEDGGGKVEATFEVLPAGPALPPDPALSPAEPGGPSATAPPKPSAPAPGAGGTVSVSNAGELASALAAAQPGQAIQLMDGLYVGKFVAAASGTAAAPIALTGSRAAVLSTGSVESGYGLHITGSHWRVSGLSVTESGKGIVLDGSTHTVLSGLDVGRIGTEAVHFRANSSDSAILDSDIHDTGLAKPGFGEGIYVGSANSNWARIMGSKSEPDRSDRVQIRNNRISRTSAEGVDIKEGSTGGAVVGNSFSDAGYSGANSADSWVDIKGNGYTVSGNSGTTARLDAVQVHNVLDGWGRDNVITGNAVLGGVPGFEVWVQSAQLGNTVECKDSPAGRGLTNVKCSP